VNKLLKSTGISNATTNSTGFYTRNNLLWRGLIAKRCAFGRIVLNKNITSKCTFL
jgi:hypothetical protein